jgi:hypothetical protein
MGSLLPDEEAPLEAAAAAQLPEVEGAAVPPIEEAAAPVDGVPEPGAELPEAIVDEGGQGEQQQLPAGPDAEEAATDVSSVVCC